MLLGLKKHSAGLLLPKTYVGTSINLKEWLPIDSLHCIDCKVLRYSVSADLSFDISKLAMRKDKGVVKFAFEHHYWGIQLDATTGKLLHIGVRRSDFIEHLHDGSILDRYLGTSGDQFKLIYTSLMGLSLLLLTLSGFWLWYGPKRLRRIKTKQ